MHVNKYVMTGLTQSSITVETVLRDLARDSYLGGGVKWTLQNFKQQEFMMYKAGINNCGFN